MSVQGSHNKQLDNFIQATGQMQEIARAKIKNRFTNCFRSIFNEKRHIALKNMADGNFSNRSNIKTSKNSKLGQAIATYGTAIEKTPLIMEQAIQQAKNDNNMELFVLLNAGKNDAILEYLNVLSQYGLYGKMRSLLTALINKNHSILKDDKDKLKLMEFAIRCRHDNCFMQCYNEQGLLNYIAQSATSHECHNLCQMKFPKNINLQSIKQAISKFARKDQDPRLWVKAGYPNDIQKYIHKNKNKNTLDTLFTLIVALNPDLLKNNQINDAAKNFQKAYTKSMHQKHAPKACTT